MKRFVPWLVIVVVLLLVAAVAFDVFGGAVASSARSREVKVGSGLTACPRRVVHS